MAEPRAATGLALAVATGVAMQLGLSEVAQLTRGPEAGAATWLLHVGGWGLGLLIGGRRSPAAASALGVLLGWAAIVAAGVFGGAVAMVAVVGSGVAFGASAGAGMSRCTGARRAVAADLIGMALGAAVAIAARWTPVPAAAVLLVALALVGERTGWGWAATAVAAIAIAAAPIDDAARLQHGSTPLARRLAQAGPGAWRGRWIDAGTRVDAVAVGGGVELFLEGGTQATTPGPRPPLVRGVAEALRPRTAVIIGAGGLGDVGEVLAAGAVDVVAVEKSAAVLAAARALSAEAAALARDPRVRVVIADGRRFAATSRERFDLVLLPLTFAAAGGRPSALWPTTLFTREGLRALARLAGEAGVVCVVLTDDWLRDRLLATIGRVDDPRAAVPLAARLWMGRDDGGGAYRLATCWSPVAEIAPRATPSYPVLFTPAGLPPALRDRIAGRGTAPPVIDARPFFFDDPARTVPGPLRAPLAIAGGALAISALLHRRRRGLIAAWCTGAGFAAVELASLAVAGAAGVPPSIAIASIAIGYAAAGTLGLARGGRAWVGCAAAAAVSAAASASYRTALPTWLVEGPPRATVAVAALLAGAVAGAAAAAFATLVGAAADVDRARGALAASALGTIVAAAPVVAIERWFGPTGMFAAAAIAYLSAAIAARR